MSTDPRVVADGGRTRRDAVADGGEDHCAPDGGEERRDRATDGGEEHRTTDSNSVRVEPGDISVADEVAELWVRLADDQRAYGSHLLPESNRQLARDSAAQHAVTGGLLVAHDRGDLVGFITFSKEQGDYDVDSRRGLVHDLFVRPDYRNAGIGTRLLVGAEKRLAADGVDRVSLEAMASNTDARRFYERHGYELFRVELEKRLDE